MNILTNIKSNLSRKARRFMASQQGFTLIELLVVVAIMGVLAAVIVPNVARFAQKGKSQSQDTELKSIQTATDAWLAENKIDTIDGSLAADNAVVSFDAAGFGGGRGDPLNNAQNVAAPKFLYPDWVRFKTAALDKGYCWDTKGLVTSRTTVAGVATCA